MKEGDYNMNLENKVILLQDKEYLVVMHKQVEDGLFAYLVNKNDEDDTRFIEVDGDQVYPVNDIYLVNTVIPAFFEK